LEIIMKRLILLSMLCVCCVALSGCVENVPSADKRQAQETKKRLLEADKQVGMPDIVNFTERRLAKDILELRDQEGLTTFTYLKSLDGTLVFLTESIGYGLPYSVQFTNPEVEVYRRMDGGHGTMPQADPNGLFMPDGLSATWILVKDPETGKARPAYIEPEISVFPFKIQ
jgi:hypothetical protein